MACSRQTVLCLTAGLERYSHSGSIASWTLTRYMYRGVTFLTVNFTAGIVLSVCIQIEGRFG